MFVALTTRGLVESDILRVVEFIHSGLKLAIEASKISGPKLVDFKKILEENATIHEKAMQIKAQVENFAMEFPMPGYDY